MIALYGFSPFSFPTHLIFQRGITTRWRPLERRFISIHGNGHVDLKNRVPNIETFFDLFLITQFFLRKPPEETANQQVINLETFSIVALQSIKYDHEAQKHSGSSTTLRSFGNVRQRFVSREKKLLRHLLEELVRECVDFLIYGQWNDITNDNRENSSDAPSNYSPIQLQT